MAMLPMLVILGTSSSEMMRHYRWYYVLPLIPFVFFGALDGLGFLRRKWPQQAFVIGSAAFLLFPLVGGGYLKFPKPDLAVLLGLKHSLARVTSTGGPICVQPVLYPHLPYETTFAPLSIECTRRPGARSLLNPALDQDPFEPARFNAAIARARLEGRVTVLEAGFLRVDGPLDL